jgi:2-haloacid dehalogenase
LSNSPGGSSPSPLERAGLGDFFERSFSVDAIGKFKPAPETYQMVADELSVQTIDLVLVACHLWDTAGAQAAGCHGALLTRPHNAILPVAELPQPNFISADLGDLIQQLIKHWKKN